MSVRTATRTRADRSTERDSAQRRERVDGGAKKSSRGTKAREAKAAKEAKATKAAKGAKPKSKALAKVSAPEAAGSRSSAAKKAYERRQQRAFAILGEDASSTAMPKRATSLAARIPFVATIIGLLSLGLALTLLLTTRAAEDSYQLSAAREQNQRLAQERAAMERDVQLADSAPELAAKARELGMIPAKDPARLVVAPDGGVAVIGNPVPAEGAPAPLLNQTLRPSSEVPVQGRTPAARPTTQAPAQQPPAQQPPAQQPPAQQPPAQLAAQPPAVQPPPVQPVQPNPALPEQPPVLPAPPAETNATPQDPNGPQVQAQGEQLVPVTGPAENVSGVPQ